MMERAWRVELRVLQLGRLLRAPKACHGDVLLKIAAELHERQHGPLERPEKP